MPQAPEYPLIELQEILIEKIKADEYFANLLPRNKAGDIVVYGISLEDLKDFQTPACAVVLEWEYARNKPQNQLASRTPKISFQWAESGHDTMENRKKAYKHGEDLIYTIEKSRNLDGRVSHFYVAGFYHLGEKANSKGLVQGYEMPLSLTLT